MNCDDDADDMARALMVKVICSRFANFLNRNAWVSCVDANANAIAMSSSMNRCFMTFIS